jgi:2-polyprenyl-6-methoxyphenol hydroxylase-like FAD-dependent oxidoreductase
MLDLPVLISGGGPVGLAASLFLSQHGVRSLMVERHPSTALTPKARGINARTMEVFRQCGIDDAVRAAGLAEGGTGLIVWTETLAGREIERRVPGRAVAKNMAVTPGKNCLCAQDDLEPVIRRYAEAAGPGALRFNTELTSFSQRPDGVTGTLTDRITGEETSFTARYLIAAEGAQSRVRRALGVKMIGEEKVYDSVNILFEADLTQWVTHRPAALYFVEQEDLRATFLTINGRDRWGFLIHGPKQYGWKPQDFTPELCGELIRKAVGQPIDVKVLSVSPCRPRDAADRRFWTQHRRAGRSQSGLEDRRGPARQGGRLAARQLSRRAPAFGHDHHPEFARQRAVDGAHGAAKQCAAAARIPQRAGPDLRRQL